MEEKKKPGRKPGQRRRLKMEIARDRREVARLRLRFKMTPEEIAESLNSRFYSSPGETAHISDKQVETIFSELTKQFIENAAKDTATLKALSIKECEDMERFCMEQFEKSERSKVKRATKKKAITIKQGYGEQVEYKPATLTEANVERLHRDGDSHWIELFYKFRNRRYEILGIDPPKKLAPTNPAGDAPFEFTGAEEMRRLLPLFHKFMERQAK